MPSSMREMAPLAAQMGLAVDVDHVAAFRALIDSYDQNGGELLASFDKAIATSINKDAFLKHYIHVLKQSHIDHASTVHLKSLSH